MNVAYYIKEVLMGVVLLTVILFYVESKVMQFPKETKVIAKWG